MKKLSALLAFLLFSTSALAQIAGGVSRVVFTHADCDNLACTRQGAICITGITFYTCDTGLGNFEPVSGTGEANDDILVNSAAAADANFSDTTPGAPTDSLNVRWQKDALIPNNISANILMTSITKLGTVTQGIWQGTRVDQNFLDLNTVMDDKQNIFTAAEQKIELSSATIGLVIDNVTSGQASPRLTFSPGEINLDAHIGVKADGKFVIKDNATNDMFEFVVNDPTPGAKNLRVLSGLVDTSNGFSISGVATAGTFLRGNNTAFVGSTIQGSDLPSVAVKTNQANTWTTSLQDMGAAQFKAPVGPDRPASCAVGQVFFDSDEPAGRNWYGCTAASVWSLLGDGGGAGANISWDTTNDGTNESTAITHLECSGDGLACSEPAPDEAQIALSIGTGSTQVSRGNHSHNVGATTQVVFNDGGVLGGDAGMVYNKTTDVLTVAGSVGSPVFNVTGTTAGEVCIGEADPGTDEVCLTVGTLAANRTHTFPDLANSVVVVAAGAQTLSDKTATGGDSGAGSTRPAGSNIVQIRSHDTDCTALTDGKLGEQCVDKDDGKTWVCVPTAGDCDTAGEWKRVDSTGGTPSFDAITSGTNTTATMVVGGSASLAVPTAPADDNDTSAASTAFVQQEINDSGGRSLTCSGGTCQADAELYTDTKCINIDPASSTTDWFFYRTESAITVTGVDCIVDAATSVVMTLRECDANGGTCGATEAAITCGTTNTTESAGIDDAAVDAGDWMRVLRGTVTGSPTQATLCMTFTVND